MGHKLRVSFSKTGDMRFISHLDLLRLFQRASRRAGLAISITKGFSPHLKISITRALKLGIESASEEAVFHVDKAIEGNEFMNAMNTGLPEGVRLAKVEEII